MFPRGRARAPGARRGHRVAGDLCLPLSSLRHRNRGTVGARSTADAKPRCRCHRHAWRLVLPASARAGARSPPTILVSTSDRARAGRDRPRDIGLSTRGRHASGARPRRGEYAIGNGSLNPFMRGPGRGQQTVGSQSGHLTVRHCLEAASAGRARSGEDSRVRPENRLAIVETIEGCTPGGLPAPLTGRRASTPLREAWRTHHGHHDSVEASSTAAPRETVEPGGSCGLPRTCWGLPKHWAASTELRSCTSSWTGVAERACLIIAPKVDGSELRTVEFSPAQSLNSLQDLRRCHAAIGFCTPGILMAATDLLERDPSPSRASIEDLLSGHLCRCTGYEPIVEAIARAATERCSGASCASLDSRVGRPQGGRAHDTIEPRRLPT